MPSPDTDLHYFLTAGSSSSEAKRKALYFLGSTELVIYQTTTIYEQEITSNIHPDFWSTIETGMAANRSFCHAIFVELQESGLARLEDLLTIQQGYPSKVLHILTHMLDGFIGPDSVFYNLIEDSHWISPSLRQAIEEAHEDSYWLVPAWHGPLSFSLLHPKKELVK